MFTTAETITIYIYLCLAWNISYSTPLVCLGAQKCQCGFTTAQSQIDYSGRSFNAEAVFYISQEDSKDVCCKLIIRVLQRQNITHVYIYIYIYILMHALHAVDCINNKLVLSSYNIYTAACLFLLLYKLEGSSSGVPPPDTSLITYQLHRHLCIFSQMQL